MAAVNDLLAKEYEKVTEMKNVTGVMLHVDGTSGSVELENAMAEQLLEVFETFKRKQASYGKGNIAQFGERGVLIRVFDKIQRLINLVWLGKTNTLADETIDDTWLDIADYALIARMVRNGSWDK